MKNSTKKLFSKRKFVSAGIACSLMASSISFAGIKGVRKDSSTTGSSSSSPTSSPVYKSGKTEIEKPVYQGGTAGVSCSSDPMASKYFPLDFFKEISRDGSPLVIEKRADNKVIVKMPPSIITCGKFTPQMYQDPKTKNVTILMQLENGKSYGEYLDCLTEKSILVEGKIDHDKIDDKEYESYPTVFDYSFNKDKDVKNTMKLSFGFPIAYQGRNGYEKSYGTDDSVELPNCMRAEKIQPELVYLNKGQDVLLQELSEICRGGDAQKIAEARKSYGNADALKDIADKIKSEIDAGYLIAVKQDVKKISDAMTKIEDRISREKDTLDEATSKKLASQYADLTKQLNSKYLDPAIFRLDELMKQRNELTDETKIATLDEEIKKLNTDISEFSRRSPTSVASMKFILEKYAITDSAKQIEDVRLKSYMYGRVYAGPTDERRGKPFTFEEANQKQAEGINKFEKTLNGWTDVYLVGKGNTIPLKRTENERAAVIDKMNKRWYDYQMTEQKNYQKYCGVGWTGSVTNPVQCQEFMNGVDQRRKLELKKRDADLLYIKGQNDKLTKMGTSFNDYQKRQVASAMRDAEQSDPYGSSYSGFEDTFQERFPGYYGPQMPTTYDPSLYNMGAPGGSMSMGNMGMYNPQMVNPQMPVQPGQYQMPMQQGQMLQLNGSRI